MLFMSSFSRSLKIFANNNNDRKSLIIFSFLPVDAFGIHRIIFHSSNRSFVNRNRFLSYKCLFNDFFFIYAEFFCSPLFFLLSLCFLLSLWDSWESLHKNIARYFFITVFYVFAG